MKLKNLTLLFPMLLSMLLIGAAAGQDLKTDSEVDLAPQLQEVNEDALFLRVDELTEVVNTHTDQITELADRIKAIESRPVSVMTAPIRRNLLGTELKKPVKLSFGSVGTTSFAPVVSYSPPIVSFGTPITYSTQAIYSPPAQMLTTFPSQQFTTTRTVRRPVQQIRTTNVQYAPTTQRLGVRLGNFFGSPGNCPGGVCPR